MATESHIPYKVPQPPQPIDGSPVWTYVRIQRASDNGGGAPDTFADVALVALSTSGRWGAEYDDDAQLNGDEWYRHRFTILGEATYSDWSEEVQIDEFQVILWLLADIPDTSIDKTTLIQWVDQTIVDLWPLFWIRYPETSAQRTAAIITPADNDADDSTDERYDIPSDLYEVCRLEKVSATNGHHVSWMFISVEWEQEGRTLRIFEPNDSYNYMPHGKKRIRDISDLEEAWFQLIYWMVRKQYLDLRENQRANTARFLVFDQRTDTKPEWLSKFRAEATSEVDRRMGLLAPQDFVYDVAPASSEY